MRCCSTDFTCSQLTFECFDDLSQHLTESHGALLSLLPEEMAEGKEITGARKAEITAQAHTAVEEFMKLKEKHQHETGDYTFLLEVSAL